jgi:hypothetical protein
MNKQIVRQVLNACAMLEHANCHILAASANADPFIRVDRRPRLVRAPQVGVSLAMLDGITIEVGAPKWK